MLFFAEVGGDCVESFEDVLADGGGGDLFFEDLSNTVIQDDVFSRLLTFPNVLVTGHQAFFTEEAVQQIAEVTIENLDRLAAGVPTGTEVTVDLVG